jgi:hypothetical protein
MCEIDWAAISGWISAVGELATAVIALIALLTWRRNLRGTAKFRVAHKVLEEARLLRYFFYDARSPWVDRGEFPPGTGDIPNNQRHDALNARVFAHAYNRRYKMVRRQILVVARLRARAGAVFGDELANKMEELVRVAGRLHTYFQEYVVMIREGREVLATRVDQDWQATVRAAVKVDPEHRTDPYSLEFEQKLKAIDDLLAKFK